jgi:CrcB protein
LDLHGDGARLQPPVPADGSYDQRRSIVPVALAVAVFGALGAASRYAVDRLIEQRSESLFPWATFAVNVTGCVLFGILTGALIDRHETPAWLRVGLVMGLVGGYTTFSTFAAEALDLTEERKLVVAGLYVVGSVALGMVAVFGGLRVGRAL